VKEQLTIVKMGGAIIEKEGLLSDFLAAFVQINGKKLLVHGGGEVADRVANDMGIETQMTEGRRITDDQMIDVVIMTYGGLVNKKLVARLNARGIKGIGLTGADGSCIIAKKRPVRNEIDFGWVGDVESVNSEFLSDLINQDFVPVITPLTYDTKGLLLNTNADTVASEVAISLAAHFDVVLDFIFDHKGVMRDLDNPNSLVKSISKPNYEHLKNDQIIAGGMKPKLDSAFKAIEKGVSLVRILNTSALFQLQNPDFDEYTSIH